MTDVEFEKQRARIAALAELWLPRLGLKWWTIHIDHCRDSDIKVNGSYCEKTRGKTEVMWQYMHATITFCLPKVAECDDEELENSFVHECCHVLVHEMREWCQTQNLDAELSAKSMQHEERVVCMLANAFIWTAKSASGEIDLSPAVVKKTKMVRK